MTAWTVVARNLPEHASNPIHTDEGGRAAGFDGALVAGVTTFAYLTHPPAAGDGSGWGPDWVGHGGGEVRFRAPVLDGDRIDCVPVGAGDTWSVEARVGGETRAELRVWRDGHGWTPHDGESLDPLEVVLDGEWAGYAARAGDDLELYASARIVHPVSWIRLANEVFHRQLARGAWIHTRSRVQHLAAVPLGSAARVESTVFDRFDTRTGERAVADVTITVDGVTVVQIEHEAIVALRRQPLPPATSSTSAGG